MTTEATIINEQLIETPIEPKTSLIKTILWLVVIVFLPSIILFFGFGIFFGIQGSGFSEEGASAWFASIPVMLAMALIAPLLTLPLLSIATQAENWGDRFDFWAVRAIHAKALVKWLVAGLIFWLVSSFIGEWLNLPVEQFLLDIKTASDNAVVVILMVVTICIVVPVMEELVFRGWLYSKIAKSKLGHSGALILSSIIFTVIHTQYDNAITLVMIFLLSLLLGFVRYKSGNISYSIAIHMLYNTLATIALFFFL